MITLATSFVFVCFTVGTVNTTDDAQVVLLVLSGDVDAFALLIDRYSDRLQRYLHRMGIFPPYDEDVLQEVFLKIYRNLHSFNPSYSFSSWAYRIAHNEAVSYHRKTKNQRAGMHEIDSEQFWATVTDERDTVSALLEQEDAEAHEAVKKRLATALHSLDRKYADPLILYFFEQKQYSEIADVLRIPVATVGTRIRRAKEKLRLLLTKKGTL